MKLSDEFQELFWAEGLTVAKEFFADQILECRSTSLRIELDFIDGSVFTFWY